jgi:hypothetical protein
MKKLLVVLLLALPGVPATSGQRSTAPADLSVYHDCPMEGDARGQAVQALNRLKNRYAVPTPAQINPKVSLDAILAPGYDVGRWKVKDGATIIGYVHDVKPGGIETVNCHARDWADRDTHIELVLDSMHSGATQRMIVEVTPRWRAIMEQQGVDWSTRTLRDRFLGRWVKVTGWMLFDVEHKDQSENTAPGRPRNWRATAWEIHPITAIEVVQRP